MTNPYKDMPDYCFWSRAVTRPAPGLVDPVVSDNFISKNARVATMGSCFAQHIAKHIERSGLNYYVAESAPLGMSETEAKGKSYGVFSARYGNVYSVRQALQLFDRAFGEFVPKDAVWERCGKYIDAFRPQIQPDPFGSPADVLYAATEHLHYVREVFSNSDWLVFTLGLSEAWRSKQDGAVYPIAPGVAGGTYDPSKYEFVNFTINDVSRDLFQLITKVRRINPEIRIIMTVSPVPLIATYENRHVLVSTCYSKSLLRVAADYAEKSCNGVYYFPSYEMITSPSAGGQYYQDDLRGVTKLGVNHVMNVFSKHFIGTDYESRTISRNEYSEKQPDIGNRITLPDVICDEEVIEKSLAAVGITPE